MGEAGVHGRKTQYVYVYQEWSNLPPANQNEFSQNSKCETALLHIEYLFELLFIWPTNLFVDPMCNLQTCNIFKFNSPFEMNAYWLNPLWKQMWFWRCDCGKIFKNYPWYELDSRETIPSFFAFQMPVPSHEYDKCYIYPFIWCVWTFDFAFDLGLYFFLGAQYFCDFILYS